MAEKDLILILVAEQGYIHCSNVKDDFVYEDSILFSAISNTYIPLLNMFSRLEKDNVPFKLGLVLSPVLCTLLADKSICKKYVEWLDNMIALGDEELERNKDNEDILRNVRNCLRNLQKTRIDFLDTYGGKLLAGFKKFADKGFLELIPTVATYSYLPHYKDLKEVLNAQVEVGLHAHRAFFGETGEGLFLPYLGWTGNLDPILRSYGVNYTIVDTRSILFSETPVETGIFTPVRTKKSVVLFARDWDTPDDIRGSNDDGQERNGYMASPAYRCELKDIGYELDEKKLKPFVKSDSARLGTGYKYWANEGIYDENAALEQVKKDAANFYTYKLSKLEQAEQYLDGKDNVLTCTIPAELIGNSWHEGVAWLEQVIRLVGSEGKIKLSLCREHLAKQYSLPRVEPYPCSAEGAGYGENLLDSSNSWMMNYVRIASEKMIDLTERFPSETGIKARILNLGAKEVLLAQSDNWQKMVYDGNMPEYAKEAFTRNIKNFNLVFESLASSTVSTEWLCNLEKQDCIFPWLSYKVFSKKK